MKKISFPPAIGDALKYFVGVLAGLFILFGQAGPAFSQAFVIKPQQTVKPRSVPQCIVIGIASSGIASPDLGRCPHVDGNTAKWVYTKGNNFFLVNGQVRVNTKINALKNSMGESVAQANGNSEFCLLWISTANGMTLGLAKCSPDHSYNGAFKFLSDKWSLAQAGSGSMLSPDGGKHCLAADLTASNAMGLFAYVDVCNKKDPKQIFGTSP